MQIEFSYVLAGMLLLTIDRLLCSLYMFLFDFLVERNKKVYVISDVCYTTSYKIICSCAKDIDIFTCCYSIDVYEKGFYVKSYLTLEDFKNGENKWIKLKKFFIG